MNTTKFTHEIYDTRLEVVRSRHKSLASALKRKAIWDKSLYNDHGRRDRGGLPVEVIVREIEVPSK